MKTMQLSLVLMVSLALAHVALSQEPTMVLKHKEISQHQRPLVTFKHELHMKKIECDECHHEYDKYGNRRGGEDKAQSCANCHGNPSKSDKKVLPLTEAFHAQCKKCHESLIVGKTESGPIMCGDCHVRQQ